MCLILAAGALGSAMMGGTGAAAAGAAGFLGTGFTGAAVASGALTMASTLGSVYSAYTSTQAQKGQAEYQAAVATNNAIMSEAAAKDAEARGAREREALSREIGQTKGRQEAIMAARGLDLTTGSPLDILEASDYFGGVDQARTAENTQREAWGLRVEGQNYRSSSAMYSAEAGQYNPMLATGTTLLNAGANVADKWITRKPITP